MKNKIALEVMDAPTFAEVRRRLVDTEALRIEAMDKAGIELSTLRDGVHRYNEVGVDGLNSRTSPGLERFLTDAQQEELTQLVLDGPDIERNDGVRWRLVDLKVEIERRFSVSVHLSTVGKWLHRLNFTRLQPRPMHQKKDPANEEAFKKTSALA